MTLRLLLSLSCATWIGTGVAHAQTSYSAGSSAISQPSSATYQAGPDALPNLPPDRIAADVRVEYNARTGARERVAPTFDPFELDPDLAGAAHLRSTDVAYDLDSRVLQDGVLLSVDLYYNDDGTRDFARTRDAVFLNGEVVPIVRRDSRELECSSRVTETIYTHDRYYAPGYGGLYRPRPTYLGHFGFGSRGYFGGHRRGGFDYYRGGYDRPYRPRVRPYPRPRRPVGDGPVIDRPRGPRSDSPRIGAPIRDDNGHIRLGTDYIKGGRPAGWGKGTARSDRPQPKTRPRRTGSSTSNPDVSGSPGLAGATTVSRNPDVRDRRRVDTPRVERPRVDRPRVDRPRTDRPRVERDPDIRPRRPVRPPRPVTRKPDDRPVSRVRPRTDPAIREAPAVRHVPDRSAPERRERPVRKTAPKPPSKPAPGVARPERELQPRPRPRSPRTETGRVNERLQMFPNTGYGDSVVVRTDWDCAREDQLVLFIPRERLEAARFDGLTLIMRDITEDPRVDQTTVYDERPLYVPPNYIEGFLMTVRQD